MGQRQLKTGVFINESGSGQYQSRGGYINSISGPVSIYRPAGGSLLGDWTSTEATLWQAIGEVPANDATFITSPALTASAQATPPITLDPPMPAGPCSVRLRAQRTATAGQLRVVFYGSGDLELGASAWQSLNGALTLHTLTLATVGTSTHLRIEARL